MPAKRIASCRIREKFIQQYKIILWLVVWVFVVGYLMPNPFLKHNQFDFKQFS